MNKDITDPITFHKNLINDDHIEKSTSAKQNEVVYNGRTVKENVALYFSNGFSRNKYKIICQFNYSYLTPALRERGIKIENLFSLLQSPKISDKDHEAQRPICKSKKYDRFKAKILSITVNEHLAYHTLEDIKIKLKELNILDISNIETLDTPLDENYESGNYQIFKHIKKIATGKSRVTDVQLFPYKNIISLADGTIFLEGTALKIRKSISTIKNNIRITSADLASSDRSEIPLSDEGIIMLATPSDINDFYKIKIVNVNNNLPFRTNKKIKTYDLIFMNRGLCMCNSDVACAGIELHKKDKLYDLLINVASILDRTKAHSIAILDGINSVFSLKFWDEEIQKFNEENADQLLAETIMDRAGIRKGITIQILNPCSEPHKRCSIM